MIVIVVTSKTDGKAVRNLGKLTLFRQFYMVGRWGRSKKGVRGWWGKKKKEKRNEVWCTWVVGKKEKKIIIIIIIM
jgi:hypothetical protein